MNAVHKNAQVLASLFIIELFIYAHLFVIDILWNRLE